MKRKAIIIGGSTGIGKELAISLSRDGWTLGLVSRSGERLNAIQEQLPSTTYVRSLDIVDSHKTEKVLEELFEEMGWIDAVIICAGIGHINPELDLDKEMETIATNVDGFTTVVNVAYKNFLMQGAGHLLAVTSIAAIRGNADAPAYNASKAFMSNYLEGLTQKTVKAKMDITITNIQPGFVDTKMAKGEKLFWLVSVEQAARQISRVMTNKKQHIYISRRWRLIAWILKITPNFLYNRYF